jgi:ribonuclease P protein subunit RPR2
MESKISKSKAREEISRLFSLAESASNTLSSRYIKLALDIARKFNIKISKEQKSKFCKKCLLIFRKGNFQTRLTKGKKVTTCLSCGTRKIMPYK